MLQSVLTILDRGINLNSEMYVYDLFFFGYVSKWLKLTQHASPFQVNARSPIQISKVEKRT
jgi:hypothetical protein